MLETVAHNPRSNIETINVANEHFNGKLSGKCHRFAMLSANCFVIIPNQYRQRPCPGFANTAWCCRREDGKRCASSDVQIHATVERYYRVSSVTAVRSQTTPLLVGIAADRVSQCDDRIRRGGKLFCV